MSRSFRIDRKFDWPLPVLLTLLAASLFCAAAPTTAWADRRIALVVGNSDYKKAPLVNPRNDATDVAALLRDELGFETQLHLDLDQRGLAQAIRQFGEDARDADVRLFYYAGHGVSVDGVNYLIPVGAELSSSDDVKFEALDSARVLERMEAGSGGANVMILDACRDNPLPRATRSMSSGLAPMPAPAGSLILYATAPGEVALDGTGRNGTFTKHLLGSLGAPGVHLGDVAIDVRVAVMQETDNRQVPWSESSLTRRVFLASPPVVVSAQASVITEPQPDIEASAEPPASDYDRLIQQAYRQAAAAGDAIAQSRLGYLLDTGRFFAEDDREAMRWYEAAVAQGDVPAHVNLGALLLASDDVDRDPERARGLFETAAEAGFPAAITNLGMLHQFGEGVPQDHARARALFESAARRGDAEAATALGDLYSYGLGVEADARRAHDWYLEGAMLGSAAAQSELGYLHEQGVGVPQDPAEAFEWFSRSASQNYPLGLFNLAEMYELGKGVPVDLDQAIGLYRRAAALGNGDAALAVKRLAAP